MTVFAGKALFLPAVARIDDGWEGRLRGRQPRASKAGGNRAAVS